MKKLMVVIPVHNGEGLIEQTLDSLIKQNLTIFTIVVIDNVSNDRTEEIVKEYQGHLSVLSSTRIQLEYIKNKRNLGRIRNWNKALDVFRESDSEVCKIMFVGDTLEPECLVRQLSYISAEITPIMSCAHNVIKEDGSSYVMNQIRDEDEITMKYLPEQALEKSLAEGNWFAGTTACMMFNKKALGNLKFKDELNWAGDWRFWVDMCSINKIVYTSEILANFHMVARKGYKRMAGTKQAASEEIQVKNYIKTLLNGEVY